jgi:hypothetical protein
MKNVPDPTLLAKIDGALAGQRMFEEMRVYRLAMQASMTEARAFVEARQALLSTGSAPVLAPANATPAEVQRYLQSDHARAGNLIAWWRGPRGDYCVLVRYATTPQAKFELGVFPAVVGHWGHDLNGLTCDLADLQRALAGNGFTGAEWGAGNPVIASIQAALDAGQTKQAAPSPERARPNRSVLFLLDGERFERDCRYLPTQLDPSWWEMRRQEIAADSELSELASELSIEFQYPAVAAFNAGPAIGPMLWTLCHRECAGAEVLAESSDSLFADLEARPPGWRSLSPAVLPAWNTLLAMVDCSARRRDCLPWWLQAAASHSSASVGMLSAVDCRLLHHFADPLHALFNEHPAQADIFARLELCARAAAGNHWVLGWEQG